jgi:hypothetical protein
MPEVIMSQPEPFTLENARIIFRNFAGKEGAYNREGDRNFCVILEPDMAERLELEGWNIKTLRGREEDEPDVPYLSVSVGYKSRPPTIVMIGSRGRTSLGADDIELLDWVDIKTCDIVIRPYVWTIGLKTGVKAYVKALYAILEEDDLAIKYAVIPEVPMSENPSKPPWRD